MESFDLDFVKYYIFFGMCWSVCLKMIGVELELLIDIEYY